MGFKSNGGSFRVDAGSGNREVFYLRFAHPQGVQQLKFVYLNISPSNFPSVSPACQVTVSPLTEMIWIQDTNLSTGVAAGSSSILQNNSPCTVYAQSSRVQFLSPTEVLVRLDIGFSNVWAGSTLSFFRAFDAGLGRTDWAQDVGYTYLVPNAPSLPLSLADFRGCLDGTKIPQANPNDCVLASNPTPYAIGGTLWIRRSNITIRGVSKYDSVLQRATGFKEPLMAIDYHMGSYYGLTGQDVAAKGLVIRDLTFDGNRPDDPQGYNAPEIGVRNVDGTTSAGDGLVITNCRFLNAPYGAITASTPLDYRLYDPAAPAAPTPSVWLNHKTNGIIIKNNEFRRSLRAPIAFSLGGSWVPSLPANWPPTVYSKGIPEIIVGGSCDGAQQVDSPISQSQVTVTDSTNVQFQRYAQKYTSVPSFAVSDVLVQNNFFEQNDTGAFGIDAAWDVKIYDNAMLDNYNNGQDCGGGVIAVLSCGRKLDIQRNFLWNANVVTYPSFCTASENLPLNKYSKDQRANTYALELFGKKTDVIGNWIEYFTHEGIYAASVQDLTITGNSIRNNSRTYQANGTLSNYGVDDDPAGVMVANTINPATARGVDGITITDNEIGNFSSIFQSYGVKFSSVLDYGGDPLSESMTNVIVANNSYTSVNSGKPKNRQADVCFSSTVTIAPSLTGVQACNDNIKLGLPMNCTTAGCQ